MEIGRLGVWTLLDGFSPRDAVAFARRLESWGYSALWIPEAVGRDPFSTIAYLAAQTERLIFATGIANIYARDPMTMKAAWKTLGVLAPDRFVLGLGVSHEHLVTGARGHPYGKPVPTMRRYLDAMEAATFMGLEPKSDPPIVLGALRERMLALAARRTRGAHPYLVTPEHTERARSILGSDAWLCPEQMVMLETDPARARAAARKHLRIYVGVPNYQASLKQLGLDDADFEDGGSDRFVDTAVCWGDAASIAERIRAHHEAGADHVCIQPLKADGRLGGGPDEAALEALAPARS